MIKKEDLQAVVATLYILAEGLQTICNGLDEASAKEPVKKAPKVKEVTLEEVRGKLAELSQAGKTAEVRELIQKHGGTKLSDIEQSKYAAVLKDAEDLANAK
ncbi:rRNA biogenesis protein rrp5 [Phascolarctobacterium sp.]|uniref:rRNA biogenesis protein rrp5 n=1 Tax=Phascolarctobacterium sp. TaxID=2049039 RepID=UPI0030784891